MNSAPTDVFALAEQRLAWAGQRQAVLAQNIANANTPGYAAKDVKPFSAMLAGQQALAPARASATVDSSSSGRSINGNAVVLDEQLEKVAETDAAHQLAMNLYKKYSSLFKTALGRA